jgi:hypothetical protein
MRSSKIGGGEKGSCKGKKSANDFSLGPYMHWQGVLRKKMVRRADHHSFSVDFSDISH